MNFLYNTPFFRICLALIIGILLNETDIQKPLFIASIFISICTFLIYKLISSYQKQWIFGVAVFFAFISIGTFIAFFSEQKKRFPLENVEGFFEVELLENPIEKPRSYLCRVKTISFSDSICTSETKGNAILYLQKDSLVSQLRRNDVLLVHTKFTKPSLKGNPEEFDFGKYLSRKGFGGTAYVSSKKWKKVGHNEQFSIKNLAEDARSYLLNIYKKCNISDNEFGILAALTLGYKDALTPELRESFSTTGAMHVLAVSGLHVGIIYMILGFFFGFLGKNRRQVILKNIIIIIFLIAYAFLTGLSPSVSRATLMFSLMALGNAIGRKSQIYNTIFFSAFVLLLLNPDYLFDVGFQLSYSAVIAIVFFQPKLSAVWQPQNRVLRWCWELVCVSLVAQVGTAPFSIYYFHQFPTYFLLSNFVVIPDASVIIYSAVLLLVFSSVPFLNVVLAFLLKWVLKIMYFLISSIEHLPFALSKIYIDEFQLLALYLMVILFGAYVVNRRFLLFYLSLCCCLIFFAIRLVVHYDSFSQPKMIIFSSSKANVINLVSFSENVVICSDADEARQLAEVYWLKERTTAPTFIADTLLSQAAFVFDDKRYLVLTKSIPKRFSRQQKLNVDNLIISRKIFVDSLLFSRFDSLETISVTDNVPTYIRRRVENVRNKFSPKKN